MNYLSLYCIILPQFKEKKPAHHMTRCPVMDIGHGWHCSFGECRCLWHLLCISSPKKEIPDLFFLLPHSCQTPQPVYFLGKCSHSLCGIGIASEEGAFNFLGRPFISGNILDQITWRSSDYQISRTPGWHIVNILLNAAKLSLQKEKRSGKSQKA